MKLIDEVKLNENVKPIVLADDETVPKSCVVPGWGNTEKGKPSDTLMEVNVTLTDNEMCAKGRNYCSEGLTGPSYVSSCCTCKKRGKKRLYNAN